MAKRFRKAASGMRLRLLAVLGTVLAVALLPLLVAPSASAAELAAELADTPAQAVVPTFASVPVFTGIAEIPAELLQPPAAADPVSSPEVPPAVEPPVTEETVPIRLETEGGMCSGFFTSADGWAASAAHCYEEETAGLASLQNELFQELLRRGIDPFSQPGIPVIHSITLGPIKIVQPDTPGSLITEPREVSLRGIRPITKGDDYAILKLDNPPAGLPFLEFSDAEPELGDGIWAAGYPALQIEELEQAFNPDPNTPSVPIIDILDRSDFRPAITHGNHYGRPIIDGVERLGTTSPMDYGKSGGVCLNEDFKVVGVVSGGFFSKDPYNFCTFTGQLKAELEALGAIAPDQSAATLN